MRDRERPFVPTDEIRFGWRQTWSHWRLWLIVGAIGAFLSIVHNALVYDDQSGARQLLGLVVQGVQVAFTLAAIRLALRLADEKPPDLDLRTLLAGYWTFLLTQLLLGLIVAGGLLLLIVPGIVWALTYGFAPFLCAAERTGVIDSLRESRRITVGHRGTLLWFGLLCFGVNLLGALALGVGLVFTFPTTFIAAAHVLRRLQRYAPRVPSPPLTDRPLEVQT